VRYQAYRTGPEQIILTVSQLYPVREVAEFEVAPHTSKPQPAASAVPEVPWTEQDLADLAKIANATTLAIMDLCSLSSGTWIAAGDAYQRAGVTTASGTGQLGGFGLTVRAKFKRSNPPYERQWLAGGTNQAYYRMGPELGSVWREIRGESLTMSEPAAGAQVPMDGAGKSVDTDAE